ncbi:MAG: ABC transporter ATP-binding protein [Clostridium sp.]
MFKLIKYLKKSTLPILAILFLLIIQAVCDLSLPDYTSNIVNIGIQQNGVTDSVPTIIRESELNKLTLFMNEQDKTEVLNNYTLLDKSQLSNDEYTKYVKKYPQLENSNLFKLNTTDKNTLDSLNSILGKPILTVGNLEKNDAESIKMKEAILGNMPPAVAEIGKNDIFKVFEMMPKEQRSEMLKNINSKFESLPESMITQASTAFIKTEYEAIGINISSLQNNYILKTGAIMLLISLISMAATVTVGFLGAKVAATLGMDLRGKVFKKVVSFSNTELDTFSTASLITRSTNDIQQIQMLMVMLLRVVFYAPILGIGGVIKVLNTNTSMAWIIAVAVMAILSLVVLLFALAMPRFKVLQKLVDKVNLVTREILTGMLVIRAFGAQKHEEKRFDKANTDLTKTNLFVNRIMTFMMPCMMLIMNAITLLIVWNGAKSVDAGSMQVGDMMAFIQYTMQIIMSFLMLSMISIMLPRASVAAQRIDEVIKTENVILDTTTPLDFNEDKKGIIEFKNVCFKYPNADEYVLSNISFTAEPGKTTAFIGSTGSGKSTLINLIPRFYDVTKGEILVDGVNIQSVSQNALREKIGYVPQKGILFSGTIDSNLRYGKQSASIEEIKKAAEIAQAIEFISSKPDGYSTEIAQGGTNVSGGQKQRLSIARAIAKNPEIYIFDDSFSALDYKTDITLRKALGEYTKESTVLIVAQRISTILHADQIVVLDEGHVVGVGTHKELLKNCEVYKEIAMSQLSKEELDHE